MSVSFNLTTRQKSNLAKGKPVQLSHQQLAGQKADAVHLVELTMAKKGITRMNKAIKEGKGFRINPAEHLGGDLFGSIGKSLKKGANDVGDTLSKAGKKAGKTVSGGLSEFVNVVNENDIGGKIESVKKVVPKSTFKSIIKLGLVASGMDESQADLIAGSSSGAIYENDFNEPLQPDKLAMGALKGAASSSGKGLSLKGDVKLGLGIRPQPQPLSFKGSGFKGSGFKGSGIIESSLIKKALPAGSGFEGYEKPKKGSPAMKEKMAKLRAMRKKGGSFKDS